MRKERKKKTRVQRTICRRILSRSFMLGIGLTFTGVTIHTLVTNDLSTTRLTLSAVFLTGYVIWLGWVAKDLRFWFRLRKNPLLYLLEIQDAFGNGKESKN